MLLDIVTALAKWQSCSHLSNLFPDFLALAPHNPEKVSPNRVVLEAFSPSATKKIISQTSIVASAGCG